MNQTLFYIGVIVLAVLALYILFYLFISFQRARRRLKNKYAVVQVRVSRENEVGPIVMEQIFSTLHGIDMKFSLWEKLKGYTSDHVSFELASISNVIKFYVAFPKHLRNSVEGQIYAHYPDVEIEDCEDYSVAPKFANNAYGMEFSLTESDLFPIKRYPQFEDKVTKTAIDPMAGVTSALVRFDHEEDQGWIQVVSTPLPDKWRIIFTKCVKIVNKGLFANIESLTKIYARAFTTRKIWPKIVLFPIYMIFWAQGFFVNANIKISATDTSSDEDIEGHLSVSHDKETAIDAALDKVIRMLFSVNIRVVYLPKEKNDEKSKVKLKEIASSFKQFAYPHLNGFEIEKYLSGEEVVHKYHNRVIEDGFVLNNEELATIYHLPNLTVKTPTIFWVKSKKLEPPSDLPFSYMEGGEPITILGKTNYRGSQKVFGIKPTDRRRHIYIIGKTGMGKSTILENMIYSDIIAGRGVGVVDPHGDLADNVLNFIPKNRINDVVLIDPSDREYAVAFNMLENIDPALNSIVCSGLVGIFKKIYGESWGPRLEHILRNTILALLEFPGSSMLGIIRILQDDAFRRKVISKLQDPVVKSFWVNEFEKMQDKIRIEAISPILNKVGQFLSSSTIRNIVGQATSTIDLRFFMDKGKIVIVNLSKGKIGEDNSALLGSMFITKFQLDAMSRANIPEKDRKDFYLYVDEFQNFATESFATILSEARKYKLNLTMANQYIAQMKDEVRDAVFGNVGSILAFQVGFDDAEYISQQFGEEVLPPDLVSLSKYNSYMRLLVDGMPTKTFSLATLPPPKAEVGEDYLEKIRDVSRQRYSKKVSVINDKIKKWSETNRESRDGESGEE
ncbi:MAG: type IV secretory system conjugative DNA transfer family protein [Candidatus Gracilibacteria bacterium]|jgi:hypothetical protein